MRISNDLGLLKTQIEKSLKIQLGPMIPVEAGHVSNSVYYIDI